MGKIMNLLGINISHNCSIAFYKDKFLSNLYEEERFNNKKNFIISDNPSIEDSFLICLDEKLNFKPDIVCYASFGRHQNKVDIKTISKIQRQLDNPKYYFNINNHHIYHVTCGFYFSNFNEAMAIVIDGGGSHDEYFFGYRETESIYYISKNKIIKKYQHKSNRKFCLSDSSVLDYSGHTQTIFENGVEYLYTSQSVGGLLFNNIACQVGLKDGPGKVMGLASYSQWNKKFDLDINKIKKCQEAQDSSFERTCWLIEKAFEYKKITNFVLSGGYFQNCSNNFKYVKKYPNFNFFVDPVPTDAGTAIGVCIYYENYL